MTADLEFFFDPACPFCWVTSRWVRDVQRLRDLDVSWRFISLAMLNEGAYDDKPEGYPAAHHRGLQLLRVAAAIRDEVGPGRMGDVYDAFGGAMWRDESPIPPGTDVEDGFLQVLEHTAEAGDLSVLLADLDLPQRLADAADDPSHDALIRADTEEGLARVGGNVGTPILSFTPPDGPAVFGPVISAPPDDDEDALRLWDAVVTLGRWPGFAELKRSLRQFPSTPLTAPIAGKELHVS